MGQNKGVLVRWVDKKGFGFIKPDQGGSDMFVHVSEFKKISHRPVVGEVIYYATTSDANGRSRAVDVHVKASENVSHVKPIQHKDKSIPSQTAGKGTMKVGIALVVMVLGFILNFLQEQKDAPQQKGVPHAVNKSIKSVRNDGSERFSQAFKNRQSDVQIAGAGIVVATLPDDREGSQHQKFILKFASGQTVLVAHNIDLAPRINTLRKGDTVEFYGEYEWNSKGGVLHWTHHDPRGNHANGWLKHQGSTYQ